MFNANQIISTIIILTVISACNSAKQEHVNQEEKLPVIQESIVETTASAGGQCDQGEQIVKFSFVSSAKGHPKGEAATAIAKRINAEMNGTLCMQLFPNSQLYDDKEVITQLLQGNVQVAAPSLSKMSPLTKKYRIFELPFMFKDINAANRFIESPKGQTLLGATLDKGVVGLSYIHNGMKHLSANKPLVTPNDADDLVFRVSNSVSAVTLKNLGAEAKKLSFRDVYSAISTGVVDGQENTWSNIYTKKFYEVQDGITETSHQLLTYLAITSKKWLDSLPQDTREQFVRIFKEETLKANQKASGINQENRKKILAAGAEIRTLTDSERAKWVEAMKPVWDKYRDDIGQEYIDAALSANL